jgi:ATP-dependent RNA helicase MSS116
MLVKAMRSSLPWGIKGTRVFEMHSKKTQGGREKTSAEFRAQSGPGYSILVTSDVSARGVDYPGVTRVIQVGVPGSKDTYVHRIGRTGRAGKSGRGDIILLPWEAHYLQSTLQQLPLQPSIVKDFQAELETLAEQVDANPPAPVKVPSRPASRFDRRPAAPISLSMQHPVLPRVQKLEHRVTEEIIPELSEIDAQEAFASQLGFYVARSPELRMSRAQVYEELQNWAVEALGLAQAPNVSPRMMQTLGIGKTSRGGKTKGFGVADSRRRGYEDLRSFRNDGPRSAFRPFRSDQRPSYGSRDQPRTFGNRDQPRMFGSRDQRPSYGSRDGGNRNSDRSGPFERRDRRMPF